MPERAEPTGPRILIFSASIGEGHDGPARRIAEDAASLDPPAAAEIADFLDLSPILKRFALGGSRFHSRIGSVLFDGIFWLITDFAPTRWVMDRFIVAIARRRLELRIGAADPDVIVSTYPGATIAVGALRERGRIETPVVSAITDLAALRPWAHRAMDLHLIIHPESEAEVRAIAPASRIVCARGMTSAGFDAPVDQADARHALGLPAAGAIVIVSGGGWAVGDLEGAIGVALARGAAAVVCMCGRNRAARARLASAYASDPQVRVIGFTNQVSDLFAAADVVVHSTAGLTVLEALLRGCRVISYGWGHGHVRVNNRAYERFGLAEVARDQPELGAALDRALAAPRVPDASFAELPDAAALIAGLAA